LNAINAQMGDDLNEALRDAERSPEVRCVLLTAAGRGFCAGADLREQSPGHTKVGDLLRTRYNRMVAKIRTMEKPVIAAVNGVVPHDDLMPRAREWALRLAAGPTRTFGLIKRGVNRALAGDLEGALDYEAHLQEIASRTDDHREGVAAFLAKRPPAYTGR